MLTPFKNPINSLPSVGFGCALSNRVLIVGGRKSPVPQATLALRLSFSARATPAPRLTFVMLPLCAAPTVA